ncbi:MAG: peptidoglycan editing factor PgeF [Spirochaetales bacterium]|nr:peptidoglycan editing factor PgeF [Spirochaetales bacterium]
MYTEKLLELNGYILKMSLLKAGSVGKSFEKDNRNRIKILKKEGLVPEKVYFVKQQHSKKVISTDECLQQQVIEADGIVTADKNAAIAVTVADCMPVFLHDKKNDVRAIVHSGWKGTGIVEEAIKKMKKLYGSEPSEITALLGPSIRSCCYNVDENRALLFNKEWGADSAVKRDGQWFLSLDNANKNILKENGVDKIICNESCTCCNEKKYGSFRREGAENYTLMFVISYLNQL